MQSTDNGLLGHDFTNASDCISQAVALCSGKFALGIVTLTNLYQLKAQFSEDPTQRLAEAFRQRLDAILRPGDELVPLANDMVCLILDNLVDSNHLHLAALKVSRLFDAQVEAGGRVFEMNVCTGMVYAGRHTRLGKTAGELYKMAEDACSGALMGGKPFTIVNAAENQSLGSDWQLNQRLHAAMENHHIGFDYQPKVHLENGDLAGGEALIRWRDKGQIVSPEEYLVALNDEVLWQLTIYGYRRVLREILGHGIIVPVSFTITTAALTQPDFLAFMLRETRLWGIPTNQITFQITGNKELNDLTQAKALFESIRTEGFKISLRDFGASHSNLQWIRELPLDEIKLDHSLCGEVIEEESACRTSRSIIELANTLNIACVAEGIEDANTMEKLKELGCKIGQGFYLGAPMSMSDFVKLGS